jgi:hypothetical protein
MDGFVLRGLLVLDFGSCEEGETYVVFEENHKKYLDISTLAAFFVQEANDVPLI